LGLTVVGFGALRPLLRVDRVLGPKLESMAMECCWFTVLGRGSCSLGQQLPDSSTHIRTTQWQARGIWSERWWLNNGVPSSVAAYAAAAATGTGPVTVVDLNSTHVLPLPRKSSLAIGADGTCSGKVLSGMQAHCVSTVLTSME
jgi:hypothetical protein